MPVTVYYILHILGILALFTSYGALIARSWTDSADMRLRKLCGITSGIALLFILVSAFGLQARLGITFDQGWFWVKLFVWLALGVMPFWINRNPRLASLFFWLTIALGAVAVLMVYLKPF